MKVSALIKLIIWSVVAVILIVILVNGIHLGLNFWHELPQVGVESYSYEDSDSYSIGSANGVTKVDPSGVQALAIDWNSDAVTIVPYDGEQIICTETAQSELADTARLHYLIKDGVLHLEYATAQWYMGINELPSKTLQVQVPRRHASQLTAVSVDSASAAVTIQGLTAQKISVDNTSGSIELAQLNAAELEVTTVDGALRGKTINSRQLDLELVSGSLTFDQLTATNCAIDTTSGHCTLNGNIANLNFSATSASCTVTSSRCPQQIDSDTVSGSFTLNIPVSSSFSATLDSVSGSLDCDLPSKIQGEQLLVGDGKNTFRFNSTSGGVQIHAI